MNRKYGTLAILILFANFSFAQTAITNLLYAESEVVFKGKVEKISYIDSNGEGSYFGIKLRVDTAYKGVFTGKRIGIITCKADVIDLERDTLIFNYSFKISEDSTYIFFTNNIKSSKDGYKMRHSAKFTDADVEGLPFSKALEQELQTYNWSAVLKWRSHNGIMETLKLSSDTIFYGKVRKIKRNRQNKIKLIVDTSEGKKKVIKKTPYCICKEMTIQRGGEYMFYTVALSKNKYMLIDEWIGVFEADNYQRVKYKMDN